MIKKVIIPVAGLGTRFLPVTKVQPKEMLPVVDKPIVQYLVEEAVASGITEVIFVTGEGKRTVKDHFSSSPELERALKERGKGKELESVRAISELANFSYVVQEEPRGDGDAILCAEELVGDEPVAVLFGDDMFDSRVPGLLQIMKVFEKYKGSVVSLCEVPREEVSRYGIADVEELGDDVFKIKDFIEKPDVDEAPSCFAAAGRYVITPEVFEELRKVRKSEGEELRLADALEVLSKRDSLYGMVPEGKRYDCGSKIGFLKATVDLGLKHGEVKEKFEKFLRERFG